MSLHPMVIAPFKSGLVTDVEPWLAPPDSFRKAVNVHIHNGYLQKRGGYTLFGTLANGTRVMGIERYLQSDGVKITLAFDTTEAYLYDSVGEVFTALNAGAAIFDSDEYDYIWSANWQSSNVVNRVYFTNGKAWDGVLNGIKYFSSADTTVTVDIQPSTGGGNTLYGGKLIFVLGQRLIIISTFENDGVSTNSFPQRARWCSKQNPANWDDVVAGGGDFADAGTGDQVISARTMQNQIIVFFTNSVWSLVPTSDPNKAFKWIRLNSYRACDGKMASVGYDRFVASLGIRGIVATDGVVTQRIDFQIHHLVNNEINIAEFKKVFCYRSYETFRWWTLFPSVESSENNSVLIYDDESKAYTTYDLSLNCIGYGNAQLNYGLDDFTAANNLDYSLDEMGDDTLQDWYFDENEDILLGGDTSGNIFQLQIGAEDNGSPIEAEFITASWNPYQNEGREAQMSYIDFYVDSDKKTKATVEFYKNDDDNPYATQKLTFFPNLNYIASISETFQENPARVNAPQHGLVTGDNVYIYGVEGMDQINSGNGFTVTVVNENFITLDNTDASAYSAFTSGGAIYLRQFYQQRTNIRAYGGGIGYTHHVRVTLSGGERPFRFQALRPYFRPRGKRMIN